MKMMDAVAGIDSTGLEVNNTVIEIKSRATQLSKYRKQTVGKSYDTSEENRSVNIWNDSEGSDNDEEVDWQDVLDERNSFFDQHGRT